MRITKSKSLFAKAAIAAGILACCAGAQANLVVNGGFETGDFSGWNANIDHVYGYDSVDNSVPAHEGNYAAYFGNVGAVSTISQSFTTTAGQGYALSFWLQKEEDGSGNSFSFSWGGTQINAILDSSGFDYQEFSYILTGTGGPTELSFAFNDTGGLFWDFDSVELRVPEPGALSLTLLAGALALGIARRRRPSRTTPQG